MSLTEFSTVLPLIADVRENILPMIRKRRKFCKNIPLRGHREIAWKLYALSIEIDDTLKGYAEIVIAAAHIEILERKDHALRLKMILIDIAMYSERAIELLDILKILQTKLQMMECGLEEQLSYHWKTYWNTNELKDIHKALCGLNLRWFDLRGAEIEAEAKMKRLSQMQSEYRRYSPAYEPSQRLSMENETWDFMH